MNYSNAGYIYEIVNKVNGKRYIGSTINYKARWHTHRSALRNGKHHSFILQRAWDKHGADSFEFKLLLVCEREDRIDYENRFMVLQDYNVLRTPKERLVRGGWKHSEEAKQTISAKNKGLKRTPEQRKNLSNARIGMKYDEAFKQKAQARQLGETLSEATRHRLSEALKKARATETELTLEKVQRIYEGAVLGAKIRMLCHREGIATGTFYSHCKALGLPNLKQKVAA